MSWLGEQGSNLPSPDSKSVMLPTTLSPNNSVFNYNPRGIEPPHFVPKLLTVTALVLRAILLRSPKVYVTITP